MIRLIGRTVILGVACGPLIALVLGWLMGGSPGAAIDRPVAWLVRSAYIGTVFALSFSLICGPPIRYLSWRLRGVPLWKLRGMILLAGACAGSLAIAVVAAVLSWTLDLHFGGRTELGKNILIDGAFAAALGLFISSYARLKGERDAQAARAEAAALTAQIRPHFLFNTLNAISAQVLHDPAAAQENLGRLGGMFRYTMIHARQDSVPLCDEIALAREYLLLEQARLGDRLRFHLPEELLGARDVQLPGLTLQPLVENAVRHGIAKRVDSGCVSVSVERAGKSWILKVCNPTFGNALVSEDQLFREGHALWILRKRLPALKVRQEPPGLFEVEVRLS